MTNRPLTCAAVAFGWVLTMMCPAAFALNPSLDVSQYVHTAWRAREGFPKGAVNDVAQTLDGYLWLGTEFGLVRFDGVRPVDWQPPHGVQLPSNDIWSLLVTRDGTLWIGTSKGLASWHDGTLTQYPELRGMYVTRLVEDREGALWAGAIGVPSGRLCSIRKGTVDCIGEDGRFGHGVFGLYEDRAGALWVGVGDGLWRWKPDAPAFHSMPGASDSIQQFAEDQSGALLFSVREGIRRLVGERVEAYGIPGQALPRSPNVLFRDRDGALWIGTTDRGLLHVHGTTTDRTDSFLPADGLSGAGVARIFQDREGTIWAATNGGIDRFRDPAVATFTAQQGLSGAIVRSVLSGRDRTLWVGTERALNRWNDDRFSIARSATSVNSLFEDTRGRVWMSTLTALSLLDHDRAVPVIDIAGEAPVRAFAEDAGGDVWIALQDSGLVRFSRDGAIERIAWKQLGRTDFGSAIASDPSRKGLWIGFFNGGVAQFADGAIRASFTSGDGLGVGRVNGFHVDTDGTLWAATAGGLSRLKNGRITTLNREHGLPCDSVHWAIPDDTDSLWLLTGCGLLRIARRELDKRPIQVTVFDASDGVRTPAEAFGYSPQVAKSADGKIWFPSHEGLSVIDPHNLPFNRIPPPVRIEQIAADRKPYDAASAVEGQLRLPALTRDVEIDYTALSLVAPEKNRFRIKLEGWDRDWEDVGNRRQAFYNNLPPRRYRFRVAASNNSGVWSEAGAALDFAIAPAYYQTTWFRAAAVLAAAALLWAAYQYRLRQVAREFETRMQSRVDERTRIARDLHDTLLQSFHGVMFRFQAAANVLHDRPADAMQHLETALRQGTEAISEGRDAVQGLRSSTTATTDLADVLGALGEELAAAPVDEAHGPTARLEVAVHGTPRALRPIVRDDIYRIGSEALRNAFRHARARQIELEIRYDAREFLLSVRDNGGGIDAAVVDGQRAGRFGLPGMRERAEQIGGRLEVWSEAGMGTEVALTIPGAAAYADGRPKRDWLSSVRRMRRRS